MESGSRERRDFPVYAVCSRYRASATEGRASSREAAQEKLLKSSSDFRAPVPPKRARPRTRSRTSVEQLRTRKVAPIGPKLTLISSRGQHLSVGKQHGR